MVNSELGTRNSECRARPHRAVAHWLLGLVLACGGAVVWLVALKIVVTTAAQWSSPRPRGEHHELAYLAGGEPVVRVVRYRLGDNAWEHAEQEFQSLDGQPLSPTSEMQSNVNLEHWQVARFAADKPSSLVRRLAPFHQSRDPLWWRRELREPFTWSARLQWFHEQTPARVPTSQWFFVWPDRRAGTGYFVGYDLKTKSRLGYLGTAGLSSNVVPESQQFPAWNGDGTRVARLVTETTEWNQENSTLLPVHDPQNPFEAGLYFVTPDRNHVYRISFTKRTVDLVRSEPNSPIEYVSIRKQYDPSGYYVDTVGILLRFRDRLEFVDHALQTQSVLPLPDELRDTSFSLTRLSAGGLLASYDSSRPLASDGVRRHTLLWLDEQGQITRRAEVRLPTVTWSLTVWQQGGVELIASLMPANALSLLAVAPFTPMLNESGQLLLKPGERLTLSSAFRAMDRYIRGGVGVGWTSMVLCLISGIPFAVLCWRKQRLLGASLGARIAWVLLVYSFGLVGWIAFAAHREWPTQRTISAA